MDELAMHATGAPPHLEHKALVRAQRETVDSPRSTRIGSRSRSPPRSRPTTAASTPSPTCSGRSATTNGCTSRRAWPGSAGPSSSDRSRFSLFPLGEKSRDAARLADENLHSLSTRQALDPCLIGGSFALAIASTVLLLAGLRRQVRVE